jgi:hypothetical protein
VRRHSSTVETHVDRDASSLSSQYVCALLRLLVSCESRGEAQEGISTWG